MVCYCCVKGCKNNSNNKKKDPSFAVSFHTFPSNPELRQKWLRAIGRPNWRPPSHARICSAHFSADHISLDGVRTRIADQACPVYALPPNSNFEATHMEVCRICLADDVKMYSIHTGVLRTCMESVIGFNENANIEGLPQFVCYICAALLIKCYKLVERSLVSQVTLLDIFSQNGQITKCLIKEQDREELKLTPLLQRYKVPSKEIEIKYDEKNEFSINIEDNINGTDEKDTFIIENGIYDYNLTIDYKNGDLEKEDKAVAVVNGEIDNDDDCTAEANLYDDESEENCEVKQVFEKKPNIEVKRVQRKSKVVEKVENDTKVKRTRSGLTSDENSLQEHFNIVKLSLEDQIEEWKTSVTRRVNSNYVHGCDVCGKMFAHLTSLRNHTNGHHPSRGPAQCKVCKLRFKSDSLASSHAKYAHTNKFYCKTCPKYFTSVAMARKHNNYHSGHKYVCPHCTFSSAHASSCGAHVRTRHAALACALCGRACTGARGLTVHRACTHPAGEESETDNKFKCDQCDMSFATEVARRVHTLTSSKHRKKPDLCDPTPRDPALHTSCRTCGKQFESRPDLLSHIKTQHPRRKVTSWSLPDDRYPQQCEHCEVTVNNRSEHWSHIRRNHPAQRDSYRPVVNAVCDTCGKGFQNTTKLHLHELRHRSPTVRCSFCPKLFYDKFLLATHLSIHSEARPHRCRTCGRGFKSRSNMERHSRVHTDVATYECTLCGKKFKYSTSLNMHVRSVHYKIPPPPRKKRSRTKNTEVQDSCRGIK